MNVKQILIDIAVVLGIPILVVGGYFIYLSSTGGQFFVAEESPEDSKLLQTGASVKAQLEALKAIRLDGSLFTDPAYLSLEHYPVDIGETTFGREYPFSPTPEVEELIRRSLDRPTSGIAR